MLTYGFFPIATPVAKHLRGHSVFDGMACSVLRVRTALLYGLYADQGDVIEVACVNFM